MEAFGAVLVGVLLRFGMPILLTVIVIALLRRLDIRWQNDAQERLAEVGGLVPTIRCWVLNDCPPERRERCPAYAQQKKPCWQVFRDGNGQLRERCLDCNVFREAPIPIQI